MTKIGRPKGGKNRSWSQEEKLRIVRKCLDGKFSTSQIAAQERISNGLLCNWIKKYLEQGSNGLKNKVKTGNPLAGLLNKKNLTEIEELRLLVAKQQIEIARLKKGYQVKEEGGKKLFRQINE